MAETLKQTAQGQAAVKEITLGGIIDEAGEAVGARSDSAKRDVERQVTTFIDRIPEFAAQVDKTNLSATISAIIAPRPAATARPVAADKPHPARVTALWRAAP